MRISEIVATEPYGTTNDDDWITNLDKIIRQRGFTDYDVDPKAVVPRVSTKNPGGFTGYDIDKNMERHPDSIPATPAPTYLVIDNPKMTNKHQRELRKIEKKYGDLNRKSVGSTDPAEREAFRRNVELERQKKKIPDPYIKIDRSKSKEL